MIYSSWDIEQNILKLVILDHFLPFHPTKNPKNQTFEKRKKLLEMSLFDTCVPKITIIWCTVPEILSETDRIFCHFGPFSLFYHPLSPLMIPKVKVLKKKKNEKNAWRYYPFIIHVYHKWRSWYMVLKYKVEQTEIFDQNFKIEKNTWRYYYFIHLHHK